MDDDHPTEPMPQDQPVLQTGSTGPTGPAGPAEPTVGWGTLLWRGTIKRCPRCGGRRLYRGWFRMVDRCGTCGIKFEREPGFFVGAYLINFAIIIIILFVLCMGYVAMKAIDHSASLTPIMIVGLVFAVVAPVLFYPYSRTIWSAIDIGMTPLTEEEIAEAAAALERGEVGRVVPRRPSGD